MKCNISDLYTLCKLGVPFTKLKCVEKGLMGNGKANVVKF